MNLKVLLLDCQQMFVQGFNSFLHRRNENIVIEDSCCLYQEALDLLEEKTYDIFLFELNIADMDGVEIVKDIKKKKLGIPSLIVSAYNDPKFVRAAMLAGADGFVSKKSSYEELIYGIKQVYHGEVYIGEGLSTTPAAYDLKIDTKNTYGKNVPDAYVLRNRLTQREVEILGKITEGKNNKQIGSELYISDQTVGVHRKNIMKKLGLRNTVKLIKFAIENHLV